MTVRIDDEWSIRNMREHVCYVIPAAPGFSYGMVLAPEREGGSVDVMWTPIIAWKIYVHKENPAKHMVDPVTAVDDEQCSNDHVIRLPDGVIDVPADRHFPNWEEARAYLTEAHEAELARRKAG